MKQIRIIFFGAAITFFLSLLTSSAASAGTCEKWVAKIVSVQGNVQVRLKDKTQWDPVQLNNAFCPGDILRVQEMSRAAVALINETVIRLDQNTTLTFSEIEKEKTSLIDIVTGVVHFISRVPRTLKINTPFVEGNVEGTEFLVSVFKDHAIFTVYEGQVLASNESGSMSISSGQSAIAREKRAPEPYVLVRPKDAVQWALYYPPIIYSRDIASADWQSRVSSLLSVGRVDEAKGEIDKTLGVTPDNSDAFAFQSIIAVVQNEKDKALTLAKKAVELAPDSASAHIALSYAHQAGFELKQALSSLKKAVSLEPGNSPAWARLSELQLSFGKLDKALESAKKAVELNPSMARTQTVLGYAYLSQIKTGEAIEAFEKAITLDQADPLPRLGLGLAKIRKGNLEDGRREIEIAASLDPNNSLIRSYLGKSYHEEKRDKLAGSQLEMAEEFDSLDPTPLLYDAIRKQSLNRPVEALHDLQKSIELNDNRAIYRSKLLLDEDLASRSAGLARIYNDLGFQQLALVEGWNSVNTDPANYSAHRFLADSYSALPRHEIARVSELLQAQLLQPLNITPVQPHLAESNLSILSGTGPADMSFNEFNPVFNRNRFSLQISGVAGGNNTYGDELVISGVQENVSLSVGRFHYKTDGFRENNDQDREIYNIFAQTSLSHKTSIQAELRLSELEKGDLSLYFDPDNFFDLQREIEKSRAVRLGLHHNFTPESEIIASVIYRNLDDDFDSPLLFFKVDGKRKGYMAETQHLFRTKQVKFISGAGYFNSDFKDILTMTFIVDPLLPPMSIKETEEGDVQHSNIYVYSLINYPEAVTWTLGGSADFLTGEIVDRDQFNPKFGVTWNPLPKTALRAAAFRGLQRSLVSSQTIEPTQVSGFNQFFEDGNAADFWHYGIAIDQKFTGTLYGGVELSKRDIKVPFEQVTIPQPPAPPVPVIKTMQADWDENIFRAYFFWTPHVRLAVSGEYQYERFKRGSEFVGPEQVEILKTHKLPLGINFFHPSGFIAKLKTTYVTQEGVFFDSFLMDSVEDDDQFWVVDASIGYRLPKRRGIVSIEAKNLFDNEFKFQDTDPANPDISLERLILGKWTLAF